MINFIYGNPGTGKTNYIYSCLINDADCGRKAILIVPEQSTVSTERDVMKLIPPSAQLSIEVLNFSRLANRLFREHGGLAYNFASRGLQKLLMWRAIRIALPFLNEYHVETNDDYSLSDAMLATYRELTACGISLDSLESAAALNKDSVLASKIKDISTVCSIYSAMLEEKYTDTNNELARLSHLLEDRICLSDINVYIDGFTSFTGLEHRIIRSIMAQANSLTVAIGIPKPTYCGIDTLSLKQCSDRLRGDCAALGLPNKTIELNENRRTSFNELAHISSDLWAMDNCEPFTDNSQSYTPIELFRAADIYDECEFASAKIRELIEAGYRYNDIAIIARDIDKYRGIIEPALENMELRYFISEKVDLSISPIARLIISALKIAIYGWKRSDVISHLKTGLCGIAPHDADIFESYTAKWNISGKKLYTDEPWSMNPDGYITEKTERGEAILATANAVKASFIGKLKTYIADLKNSATYSQMCASTLKYLEELDVHGTMIELSTKYLSMNKMREASDTVKMYDITLDALDCVCDAFPEDVEPDINTFATAIRIAFEESDLGSIPTSQDEITIGSANMLRTENIKCAVILGVCDGEFPANSDSTGLLTDNDRDYLISHGIPISGERSINASDELYYFRRAVSAPSEKLLIFTRSDSEPSIAFTRIKNIFPELEVTDTSSLLYPKLRSWHAVSEYAPLLEGSVEGSALSRLLEEVDDANIQSQKKYRDIKMTASDDELDPRAIESTIGNDLRLSQSKIELFANCKFAYSCKYYLNLDDGKRAEFAYNNIGTFIHHILEKFLFNVFVTNSGVYPDESEKEDLIDHIIEQYINELLPDNSHKSARLLHLIDRLKTTSALMIDDLLEELSDSSFKPEFFELRIGTKEIPSIRLTLKNGAHVSLNGIIDRVDVYRKDGKAYIRIIDYKTGNKTFSLNDIAEGLNLQLLLYIFSLTRQSNPKLSEYFNGIPSAAGITYLSSASSKVKAKRLTEPEASVRSSTNEIKRTGLILSDDDVISAVSHSGNDRILMRSSKKNSFIDPSGLDLLYDQVCAVLTEIGNEIISGGIQAVPKHGSDSCKYCQFSLICRTAKKG